MNNKKYAFLTIVIIAICFFAYIMRNNFDKGDFSQTYYDLGTVSEISIFNVKKSDSEKILKECGDILLNIDNTMGKTRDYTEVSKINQASGKEFVKISEETFLVIKKALEMSEASNGTFDITVGPIVELWSIGTENARVPNQAEIQESLPLVNYKDVTLDEKNTSVKLERENMKIDLGAIAKGYAADKIRDYLKSQNVESAIINLGGNIFVLGEKKQNTPFTVSIQDPTDDRGNIIGSLELSNKSVVTSGIYERYIEKDGKIYHHMINPKDGYPFDNNLSSVTIISNSSLDGDGLSTTAFGLGVSDGMKLIESIPNVDAVFVTEDKKVYTTSNLKNKLTITNDSFKMED